MAITAIYIPALTAFGVKTDWYLLISPCESFLIIFLKLRPRVHPVMAQLQSIQVALGNARPYYLLLHNALHQDVVVVSHSVPGAYGCAWVVMLEEEEVSKWPELLGENALRDPQLVDDGEIRLKSKNLGKD